MILKSFITSGHFFNSIYSYNQKTLEWEDDFKSQFITLNSPMKMKHHNYAVQIDPYP